MHARGSDLNPPFAQRTNAEITRFPKKKKKKKPESNNWAGRFAVYHRTARRRRFHRIRSEGLIDWPQANERQQSLGFETFLAVREETANPLVVT